MCSQMMLLMARLLHMANKMPHEPRGKDNRQPPQAVAALSFPLWLEWQGHQQQQLTAQVSPLTCVGIGRLP